MELRNYSSVGLSFPFKHKITNKYRNCSACNRNIDAKNQMLLDFFLPSILLWNGDFFGNLGHFPLLLFGPLLPQWRCYAGFLEVIFINDGRDLA